MGLLGVHFHINSFGFGFGFWFCFSFGCFVLVLIPYLNTFSSIFFRNSGFFIHYTFVLKSHFIISPFIKMNHHLLHKTKKYNHIKKKTRKYGKKSSAKKLLSKRKRNTRKILRKKGGVKFSSGTTSAQAAFLDSFFPDENEAADISNIVKFPYNITFDDNGTFMGADMRYYVPRGAFLSSSKYKNLSIDDYSAFAKKKPTELIKYRGNMITYFNAITRLLDASNDANGLLGCDQNIMDAHVRYNSHPEPEPRPKLTSLYQQSLSKLSISDLNRLLNSAGTGPHQKMNIKEEIYRRGEDELNSEYSPIIQLLNSNFWDFDREISGRCIDYKRKLNGEKINITCAYDGFYKACFSLKATIAGQEQQVGFMSLSQQACQYVKIRFIILMICIMFDMNQVSPEIQNVWFTEIKHAEDIFVSNAIALSYADDTTIESLREMHVQFFVNYLELMITAISKLFDANPQLQNFRILEIDLYYLLMTIEPRSFFQEYSLIYLQQNKFASLIPDNVDLVISFNQIDSKNSFTEKDTEIINRLFDFKPPDSITKYLENGVTTNIEVNEENELVLRQYVFFGLNLVLPGYSSEDLDTIAIILDEKTVNITRNTYVTLSKLRWTFNTETREKIYRNLNPDLVKNLFPYFDSIIPIDQLNPEQLNTRYNRAVLLYPSGVHSALSSLAVAPTRFISNVFGRKYKPTNVPLATNVPIAESILLGPGVVPSPSRVARAQLASSTDEATASTRNSSMNSMNSFQTANDEEV